MYSKFLLWPIVWEVILGSRVGKCLRQIWFHQIAGKTASRRSGLEICVSLAWSSITERAILFATMAMTEEIVRESFQGGLEEGCQNGTRESFGFERAPRGVVHAWVAHSYGMENYRILRHNWQNDRIYSSITFTPADWLYLPFLGKVEKAFLEDRLICNVSLDAEESLQRMELTFWPQIFNLHEITFLHREYITNTDVWVGGRLASARVKGCPLCRMVKVDVARILLKRDAKISWRSVGWPCKL